MSNKQTDEANEALFEALLNKWLGLIKNPDEASDKAEQEFLALKNMKG